MADMTIAYLSNVPSDIRIIIVPFYLNKIPCMIYFCSRYR